MNISQPLRRCRSIRQSTALLLSLAAFHPMAASGFTGAKFEPPDGKVYAGVGQDIPATAAMINAADPDHQPMLVSDYDGIGYAPGQTTSEGVLRCTLIAPGAILEIGYDLPWQNAKQLWTVSSGAYDTDIDRSARIYGEMATPILLRIGYEFDQPWTGYDPAAYKAAFRHIVSRFKRAHVRNVAFVWDSSMPAGIGHLLDWYPGDDVVDWWAFNAWGKLDATDFMATAKQHHKPVMIGEFSEAFWGGGPWSEWYAPAFESIRKSGVKAFQYINFNWPVISDWSSVKTSGQISDNPLLIKLYEEEMQNSQYLFRDHRYFNPNGLVVNSGREVFMADNGKPWSPALDFSTAQSGYGYTVRSATFYRDKEGWDKGWRNADGTNSLSMEVTVPDDAPAYLVLSMRCDTPVDIAVGKRRAIRAFTPSTPLCGVTAVSGFVQLPFDKSDIENGKLDITVTNAAKKAGIIRVNELAIQRISHRAPSPPAHIEVSGSPARLTWSKVRGADRYDVYRDGELIGFARERSFRDDFPGSSGHHSYQVVSWNRFNGQGTMSGVVLR